VVYWFGFRQTVPGPPGEAVACGPFQTLDEAKQAREAAKREGDGIVSIAYAAESKSDAEAKAKALT
jgi:hypothetical protein